MGQDEQINQIRRDEAKGVRGQRAEGFSAYAIGGSGRVWQREWAKTELGEGSLGREGSVFRRRRLLGLSGYCGLRMSPGSESRSRGGSRFAANATGKLGGSRKGYRCKSGTRRNGATGWLVTVIGFA